MKQKHYGLILEYQAAEILAIVLTGWRFVSHLAPLKQRIKSIKATRKITHAMRLVSMSLYSRLDKQISALNLYRQTIDLHFKNLIHAAPGWTNKILMPEDLLDSQPLVILISAVKGMCGSFHSNLIKYYERHFFDQEHQTVHFITIGQKATNFVSAAIAREKRGTLVQSFVEINSHSLEKIAQQIIQHINEAQPHYSSVTCYSNLFVSFFKHNPQIVSLIPLLSSGEQQTASQEFHDYMWEQEPAIIVDKLAERYLKTSLTHLLTQSLLAEQSARFMAMDSATTNADKYLEKLTLQYNKLRQAMITKEVAELTAGL